jgi:hypothetical protein
MKRMKAANIPKATTRIAGRRIKFAPESSGQASIIINRSAMIKIKEDTNPKLLKNFKN